MRWPARSRGTSGARMGFQVRARCPASQRGKLRASISSAVIAVCAIGSAVDPDEVVSRTPRASISA